MFDFDLAWCETIQPKSTRSGEHTHTGGVQRRALDSESRDEKKRGSQCTDDRAGGIGGIHPPAPGADPVCCEPERANHRGQGAAHQEWPYADHQKNERPGKNHALLFQCREKGCRMRESDGHQDTDQGNPDLQRRIQPQRPCYPVDPTPEQHPTQGESGKERADAGCDRINVNADDQRQLLDPEHLIDQCSGAGNDKQQGAR